MDGLKFNENNLFPLVLEGSHSYADAQAHSSEVDRYLGLRVEAVEAALLEKSRKGSDMSQALSSQSTDVQDWIGLPSKALLTPYTEIRLLLERLRPATNSTVVDLGAGYGRMGFVIGALYPQLSFVGYELVSARVEEGNRVLRQFSYSNVVLTNQDLTAPDFVPLEAEVYFLYDFGTRSAIEKALRDLQSIARRRGICVVGRGRASRDAIERDHPWLSQVHAAEHYAHYSIYRS